MFNILRHYGVSIKIVNTIEVIYFNSRSMTPIDGVISESFDVTPGILQGDILVPFLFIIGIDNVMANTKEK